eukprot:221502_1
MDTEQQLEQRCKNIVFGYIRETSRLSSYCNNLEVISGLCFMYFQIKEMFQSIENTMIANITSMVKMYGCIMFDHNVPFTFIWTLHLVKLVNDTLISIGIESLNGIKSYYCDCSGHITESGSMQTFWKSFSFKQGDLIKLEVNIPEKTLSIYINDVCHSNLFTNIDFKNKKYYLIVSSRDISEERRFPEYYGIESDKETQKQNYNIIKIINFVEIFTISKEKQMENLDKLKGFKTLDEVKLMKGIQNK